MPASERGSKRVAAIEHGGRLSAARAAWPAVPEPWIDLSTGINPWPYPVGNIAADAWARLPDPGDLARLEAVMASAFGVDAERVVACAGSEAALRLLPLLAAPGKRVGIAVPTYGSHADAWRGHEVVEASFAELIARIDTLDVLVVVRPNNPDGELADEAALATAAGALAGRGGWLMIDEAFVDTADGISLATRDWAGEAIILRSFGKTYGLAGVRLGAVIAPVLLRERLRGAIGDWPVSSPALAIGAQAYADADWLAETRARVARAAERLDTLLGDSGWRAVGGCPLFRLVADDRAATLHAHLARQGIWTRAFAAHPHWLRIGLPGPEADWMRLATALREFTP